MKTALLPALVTLLLVGCSGPRSYEGDGARLTVPAEASKGAPRDITLTQVEAPVPLPEIAEPQGPVIQIAPGASVLSHPATLELPLDHMDASSRVMHLSDGAKQWSPQQDATVLAKFARADIQEFGHFVVVSTEAGSALRRKLTEFCSLDAKEQFDKTRAFLEKHEARFQTIRTGPEMREELLQLLDLLDWIYDASRDDRHRETASLAMKAYARAANLWLQASAMEPKLAAAKSKAYKQGKQGKARQLMIKLDTVQMITEACRRFLVMYADMLQAAATLGPTATRLAVVKAMAKSYPALRDEVAGHEDAKGKLDTWLTRLEGVLVQAAAGEPDEANKARMQALLGKAGVGG